MSARAFARALALVVVPAAAFVPRAAFAQFNMVPPPLCRTPAAAASSDAAAYRVEASRHVYDCFPGRVYPDVLPPLVYGIVAVETEIDDRGRIVSLSVVRKPAAEEVEPWVLAMLRRAAPYPAPVKLPGATARFVETFFVDRSGLFQTLALTEGQPGSTPKELPLPLSSTAPSESPR